VKTARNAEVCVGTGRAPTPIVRFSLLLLALAQILRVASFVNAPFKRYIGKAHVKVLIKTADGHRARLFVFERGKVSSIPGDRQDFDVALVWRDAKTAFAVMTDQRPDASFNAAAEGKLRVEGMSVYARWFEDGMKLVL
jgi:hypothetical protein